MWLITVVTDDDRIVEIETETRPASWDDYPQGRVIMAGRIIEEDREEVMTPST